MKRDLFAAFKPKGTISKNDFDLTQKHVFSSRPGIVQPVCSIPVVPADYHEIDLTGIIRTMTMNTAAFVRGTWNFEAVFVPYTQLWHPFAQFITQRNDKHSSTQKGTAFCPVISLKGLLIYIRQSLAFYEYHFWNTHAQSIDRMLTAMPYVCDIHGYSWAHGALRLLDMLGYGDYSWIFQPSQDADPSEINYHVVDGTSFNAYLERMNDKYVNVFALAAYQHSWYDLFRNKFYDEQTNINSQGVGNQSYVDFFNFDDIDCRAFSSSIICAQLLSNITTDTVFSGLFVAATEDEAYRVKGLLEVRYHQWKRDRFTSAMPSAQFGDVAKYENTAYGPIFSDKYLEGSSQSLLAQGGNGNQAGRVYVNNTTSVDTTKFKVTSVVDVVAFRKAELMQQWKMNALRAGNMTDDAMQAHYGVTPYYTSDENVRHLGGWSTLLKVEPVTATSSTYAGDNGQLGDLGAKGLSSDWQGSVVKCESRDFGCIQIYAYFLPEAEYAAEMIDKEHMRHEEFDFFTKELENIGLQPEMAISLSDNIAIPSGSSENDPLLATIGFNPPNVDLKTGIDKVHAGFYDKRIVLANLGNSEINKAGTLSAWVAPKPTNFYRLQIAQGVLRPSLRNFYVNPNIFDKVMSNEMQSSNDYDNFVCNVLVVDRADRNLTVLGLPQY